MREFCGGNARTTVEQNLILRWVRDEALYDLWQRLDDLGLAGAGAFEIDDVISCPGTDSCKMGITASMGLNEAIQTRLEEMQIVDSLTRRVQIKMSGCPNGCGQHHIGTIGFYGASLKVGGRQMPAYIPHIGGRAATATSPSASDSNRACRRSGSPTRSSAGCGCTRPSASEGETFEAFAERVGNERFEAEVTDLTLPAEFSLETMQEFIDWNRSSPYKVERGEGECAI